MNANEWDRLFLFFTQAYPAWKPTQDLSLTWFAEFRSYDAKLVHQAMKSAALETDSQFPPSLFQILRKLKIEQEPVEQVDCLWERVIRQAAGPDKSIDTYSPQAQAAIRAIGGFSGLGRSTRDQWPWLKKDFARAFAEFSERKITEQKIGIDGGRAALPEAQDRIIRSVTGVLSMETTAKA